ncbi:MAG: hypothetical protein GEU26_05165 [Nitrososphaeraceae archaeon]|nr:hypothetical protein [Nitrososphaeraceae archaeon]
MPEINTKDKVYSSSLLIIVILLLVPSGLGHFNGAALEVHAQRSSSCDRVVVSLVDCSPASSTSSSSDGSSAADDSDDNDNNDDQNGEEKGGDIESKIPSTAGSGVPFP